jgi:LacI family transcriptional regulator
VASQWPSVVADVTAVSALAAEHLIDHGYQHFAFCGMPCYEWSTRRRIAFVEALRRHSFGCEVLDLPSLSLENELFREDQAKLCQWIEGLPKPVGVFACQDQCGRAVLNACAESKLSVPEEVGVIGVDNDDLVCELCLPPLSSIALNADRTGYIAAEVLAEMLRGDEPKSREVQIKPTTLVCRQSTDAAATREPIVSESLRFIRAYACQGIGALDVAEHLKVSRRFLEIRFRKVLGRTVHTEIQRVRLETAQRLLGETNWKMAIIAERSGFKTSSHMSQVFYAKLRLRPGEYRRRVQS